MTGEEYLKGDQEESMVLAAFKAGQSHPSEATALKIWHAAISWYVDQDHVIGGATPNYPDFDTFYKKLIEGK